jgi:hypothetical protein
MQVCGCSGATLASAGSIVELRDLIQANAFVVSIIEIGTKRNAALLGCLNERKRDRPGATLLGHMQRSIPAMELARSTLVVLCLQEIRQHRVPVPPLTPQVGPVIVVLTLSTDIEHGVDGRRSAKGAAPRLIAPPTIEVRLRCGVECPVIDLALAWHHDHRSSWHADDQ